MAKRPQLTGRAAILAVVVCAIAMSLAYPVREYVAQRRQIAQLEQQQTQALRQLQKLEERRKQLEDPEYIKRQAKERLHYCEPGAKCFVVLDASNGKSQAKQGSKQAAKPPWYLTLWQSVEAADSGRGAVQAGTPGQTAEE
ncbi:septation ring formation regulator EzrA [Planotetraspora thailandica]|uniref:Septation ring formation regulator EzrA n=1 Tax=Planotetraspora thailandica TaxID=487172 RepID=A0A8J3XS83_9ACTN|nr:septum formation initiator family protein [Planotetraspora thailandica]GII52927.1 septation ring formation regulator EzrA [Planotetraspora thailandica]